jgi:ABC-type multidrug transport system ATPase subunit
MTNNKKEDNVISAKNPSGLVPLTDSIVFESPILGFVLPDGSDNSIIEKVMDNDIFKGTNIEPRQFKSQDEMIKFNSDMNNNKKLMGGVVFESNDLLKYAIRLDVSNTEDPESSPVKNVADLGLFSDITTSSYLELFSPLQSAVDQAIIRLKTKDDTFTMRHFIGTLGKMASLVNTDTTASITGSLGYYVCLAFLAIVYVITLNIVKEKEDKLKDGLLIAGVHPTVFWLSWFILEGTISLIISLIMTAIIIFGKLYSNIDFFVLFLIIFLFSLSACSLGFIFSTFFTKSKTAGVVVLIFYIVFSYLVQFVSFMNQNVVKVLTFIFSSVTLGQIMSSIEKIKYTYKSLNIINIFKTDVGVYFLILLFNVVSYFILAIIFDNIFSGENGRYLFTSKRKVKDLHTENEVSYQKDIQEDFNARNNEKCMVEVSRVHKIFKKGKNRDDDTNKNENSKNTEFLAVNDVSFKVYENEICAVVGHNGAGKTTRSNIMVGLIKASYGDVFFDGSSISKNVNKIRKDFGVCAQHNIIYKELTVEDHINFYANLKSIKVDVDEVLSELDLLQQKKLKTSKLSGGQKRKLCIAMATIGNPKYIFLDEPTTGLDPLSRRKIWELLLKKKEGRVIFLTTHYMDEADILADRKLILNKGKIRCLGTSLYLKNHFNMKYNLDVETNEKERINGIIMRHLPEAVYIENEEGNEFESHAKFYTWRLPLSSSERFAPLLNELDRLSGSVINKYALSLPTLEELFIRLEDDIALGEDKDNVRSDDEQHLIQTGEDKLPKLKQVSKPSSVKLLATLVKYRLKIFLKDKAFAFSSILLPIILLALTFYFINKFMFQERVVTYKATEITVPSMYHDTKINYASNSTLPITTENIIAGVGNKISSVSNVALNEMVYPKFGENYYLSSVSGSIDSSINRFNFEVHYNDTMPHSVPATFNALSNAYLASKNINDRITVINHPFDERQDEMAIIGLTFIGLMLGMGIVSILSKFGPLSARERINQLLLQLQLNGVSRFNYWISSLITDKSIFIVTCILLILAGVAVRFEPLLDVKIVILIIIFLIIWSIHTMLYQYVISFFFKKEETAYNGISAINTYPVIIGFIGLVIINAKTTDPAKILSGVLYGNIAIIFCLVLTALCPAFGIVALLNALFTLKMYSILLSSELSLKTVMKFENMISPLLILLVILAGVYFFSLMALDRSKNQTRKSDVHDVPEKTRKIYENVLDEGDDDVKREFEYVKQHQNELPISTLHLCKEFDVPKFSITDREEKQAIEKKNPNDYTYGDIHKSVVSPNKYVKTAVVDVNFGVRTHECFGLLGPNGAGKSTTLNTVTATIPQTMGSICYNGIETHEAKLGEVSMGYCPQHDILWKELTLREHIEFFLSIRGYDTKDAKNYATQYINAAGLEEHQNKRVDDLSGGTKRKLSILIAICGYPERILLDEPTAGMDPSTRRLIWDIVKQTKRMNDSALIMTTHSMEEAEELCDRLAILVNGRLICIGSPEHLKMKFGEGYILELQSKDVDQFHSAVVEGKNLFDSHPYEMEKNSANRAKYEVKMTKNLGSVFEKMEECKRSGLVTDYSFNQTSLEQIFINFAKKQIIPSK